MSGPGQGSSLKSELAFLSVIKSEFLTFFERYKKWVLKKKRKKEKKSFNFFHGDNLLLTENAAGAQIIKISGHGQSWISELRKKEKGRQNLWSQTKFKKWIEKKRKRSSKSLVTDKGYRYFKKWVWEKRSSKSPVPDKGYFKKWVEQKKVIKISCPGQRGTSKSEWSQKRSPKSPIPDRGKGYFKKWVEQKKVIKICCTGQRGTSKSEWAKKGHQNFRPPPPHVKQFNHCLILTQTLIET